MTTDFSALDWCKLSQDELDRGLNNGAAVAGSADIMSGWSAGGHLASMALANKHVRAGVAISGIYDLERSDEAIHSFRVAKWIASRSLSSGGALRRPGGSQ